MIRVPVCISFLLIAYCSSSFAQEWRAQEGYSYPIGEKLDYDIYFKTGFLWFQIGSASFETKELNGSVQLQVSASTEPKWRKLYAFNSSFTSDLDDSGHWPRTYLRNSIKKGFVVFDSIEFDNAKLTAKEYVSNNDGELFHYNLALSQPAYDMISLFYRLRSLDFESVEDSSQYTLRLLYNRKEYDIQVRSLGLETKKVKKLGKIKGYKLEIDALEGRHFEDDEVMSLWISSGEDRRPVAFETTVKFGSLRIVLRR